MQASRRLALALVGLAAGAAACDGGGPSGDPFPIYASRAAGGFILAFDSTLDPGGASARPAVIDVLSPVTVIDLEGPPPRRDGVGIDLLAPPRPGATSLVARARFDTSALLLHPCATAGACLIGDPAAPTAIGAVIGADTLRGDAIRFEPDSSRMFVLDGISGSNEARDQVCDAVLPAPFDGGGTLVVGDTELEFAGLRISVDVCLLDPPTTRDRPLEVRGTDAAMLLSTGIGVSILGEARYEQWRVQNGGTPLASLEETTVLLPGGPLTGRRGFIPAIDIGGGGSASRGACRDAYANRLLTRRNCVPGDDCPCTDQPLCAVPSVLELVPPAAIEVVIVPDTTPLLQALRAELRPARPEVDGILGMNALAGTVLDVDYPHDRVLLRCVPPPPTCIPTPTIASACVVRPKLSDAASRPFIERCVAAAHCEPGGVTP